MKRWKVNVQNSEWRHHEAIPMLDLQTTFHPSLRHKILKQHSPVKLFSSSAALVDDRPAGIGCLLAINWLSCTPGICERSSSSPLDSSSLTYAWRWPKCDAISTWPGDAVDGSKLRPSSGIALCNCEGDTAEIFCTTNTERRLVLFSALQEVTSKSVTECIRMK